jgi:RNA polymerase sigma-70 factor (ECF subfamily)
MDRRLIIEHIPRLRRYARALVGDRYVADDLV